MVTALEGHEPRARDQRRELPPLTERRDGVARRVQHERRRAHLRYELAHVDERRGREQASTDLWRCRDALQIAEPTHLLGRPLGKEARREGHAEGGVVVPPA